MNPNRRSFLQKLGLASASCVFGASFLGAKSIGREEELIVRSAVMSPTNRVLKIALIGAGGMGRADADTALSHPNIEMVAACDLYDGNLEIAKTKWGSKIFVTHDYKDVLKRSDVDLVIIGTPDHWHQQISIDALKAGKHVYCEKPMVKTVAQGQALIEAWKKSNKVFMVGSQGLSSLGNEKAKELLEAGAIGQLNYAEGFWARMSSEGAWQYKIPKDASPKTVDWDRFVSNTNKIPFDATRFFRWRNYTDYGTGMSGDLFVHLFSSLHFVTSSLGPTKIGAMGGLRYWKDGREVPDVFLGMFDYPDTKEHPAFNLSLRCNFVDGTSGSTYLKLVGSKGAMNIGWDDVTLLRNSASPDEDPFLKAKSQENKPDAELRKHILPPRETVYTAEKGYRGAHYDHFGNLFAAIRNNGKVVEDPVFGFRACAPALLCNESYRENRFVYWDPVNMKISQA